MTHPPAPPGFLPSVPLFATLTQAELMDILPILDEEDLRRGEVLFTEMSPPTALWVLGPGMQVQVSTQTPDSLRPFVVAVLGPGESVGEMAVLSGQKHSGVAVVTEGGTAWNVDAVGLRHLVRQSHPAALKMLLAISLKLCSRFRDTSARIVSPGAAVIPTPPLPGGARPALADISAFGPFQSLPVPMREQLCGTLTLVETDGLQPIFGEREPGDAAYFLLAGSVTIGRNGRTLAHLKAGRGFGLVSLVDGGRRDTSCVADGPTRLLRLGKPEFDRLLALRDPFAVQLLEILVGQLVARLRAANRLVPPAAPTPPHLHLPMFARSDSLELDEHAFASIGELLTLDAEVELDVDVA